MRGLSILDSVLNDFNWPVKEKNQFIGELKMKNITKAYDTKSDMVTTDINFKQTQTFSDEIISLKKKWDSDPDKYSSTTLGVSNQNMSPREFFNYYRKQTDIDALQNYGVPNTYHLISNSVNNRKESKRGELFMIRTRYAYSMITGVSDSNFFPVSMIDNSDDVGTKIQHLLLKDRGNLTAVLMRYNEEILNVNQWKNILDGIESNPFNEFKLKNKRFKETIKRSKSILSKHIKPAERLNTKYSLKTMLGSDVWDEWYNFEHAVNLRISYETLGVHTNEMQAYNNTETNWIEYNFLTSAITLSSYYDSDSIDKSQLVDIHNSCVNEGVFMGEKDLLARVKHKKQEGFESWFPIDYSALEELPWSDFINEMARSSQTATKKKKKAWQDLFSKKDKKDRFITYDVVNDNVQLIKGISKLVKIEEFESELESFISADKEKRNITNIRELSLQYHTNVGILTRASKELSKKVYKDRGKDNGRRIKVADKILDVMIKAIKDGEPVVFMDTSLSITKMTRYQKFFKKFIDKAEAELDVLAKGGKLPFDSDYWWSELKQGLADRHIYPNRDGILSVWDRKDYGMFVKHEIDFSNKTGLSECHMNPKGQETTDNIFLGLTLDNILNGKRPIKNLQQYISGFEVDMDEWLKNNEDPQNRAYVTRMLDEVINDIWLKIGNN